ncbi:MAG: nitroreductase family protein, partial [Chloroflexi bacterium]
MSVDVRGSIGALIRTRRAVRAFKSGMIPDADVNEILEAARWAPSPANRQPARFIWVKSSSIKRELQELAKESKELSAYWDPIFRPDGSSGRVNDLETPEVIAVLADPAKSLTNIHADNGFEWAAAMSIYAMWLRAHSLGYGGVFVQHWITEKAKKILNVPLSWT